MLGKYQNFPTTIHWSESFTCTISSKSLQQKLIELFFNLNQKKFSFEDVAIPTVPNSTLIFEFGLADLDGFDYIDKEETKKAINAIGTSHVSSMDFFCAIRYYKELEGKKSPLKFDYYFLRIVFAKGEAEFQLFHERGPRYIPPEDLNMFIVNKLNEGQTRKILKEKMHENSE